MDKDTISVRSCTNFAQRGSKVEVSDWVPPPPNGNSNSYRRTLNSGDEVIFYIGQRIPDQPANVGTFTFSVFPVF